MSGSRPAIMTVLKLKQQPALVDVTVHTFFLTFTVSSLPPRAHYSIESLRRRVHSCVLASMISSAKVSSLYFRGKQKIISQRGLFTSMCTQAHIPPLSPRPSDWLEAVEPFQSIHTGNSQAQGNIPLTRLLTCATRQTLQWNVGNTQKQFGYFLHAFGFLFLSLLFFSLLLHPHAILTLFIHFHSFLVFIPIFLHTYQYILTVFFLLHPTPIPWRVGDSIERGLPKTGPIDRLDWQ